jgi:hypothetical protein
MAARGIIIVFIEPIAGTQNRSVRSNTGKQYVVYVVGSSIVGFEETLP